MLNNVFNNFMKLSILENHHDIAILCCKYIYVVCSCVFEFVSVCICVASQVELELLLIEGQILTQKFDIDRKKQYIVCNFTNNCHCDLASSEANLNK